MILIFVKLGFFPVGWAGVTAATIGFFEGSATIAIATVGFIATATTIAIATGFFRGLIPVPIAIATFAGGAIALVGGLISMATAATAVKGLARRFIHGFQGAWKQPKNGASTSRILRDFKP